MTDCPQCGKPISSATEPCPHCGNEPKSNAPKSKETKIQDTAREPQPKKAEETGKTAPAKAVRSESADSKPKKKPKKFRWIAKTIILGLILFIGLILIKKSCDTEPAPPSPPNGYVASDFVEFFKGFRKGLGETNTGKKYFHVAYAELKGLPAAESLPESQPLNVDSSRAATTAKNFSLALEHFKMAEKSIRDVRVADPQEELTECRKNYVSALDQYMEAANILNEYSKARMGNDAKKMKSNSPTDADANFQMGEKLMTDAIFNGCKGKLFQYAKTLAPDDRGLILLDYKEFFGDKFPEYQPQLQNLLGYQAPADTLPSETQPAETQAAPSL